MIIVAESKAQAEAISEWIADALRHNRLMYAVEKGLDIAEAGESAQSVYDRLMGQEYEAALASLRAVYLSPSGNTLRWDEPRQIPRGPYAGWWYITCPMRNGGVRDEWVYQIDPLTDQPRDRSVWDGAEIVERDPAWFDTSININEADAETLQTWVWDGTSWQAPVERPEGDGWVWDEDAGQWVEQEEGE